MYSLDNYIGSGYKITFIEPDKYADYIDPVYDEPEYDDFTVNISANSYNYVYNLSEIQVVEPYNLYKTEDGYIRYFPESNRIET